MGEERAHGRYLRVETRGKKHQLFTPKVVRDPTRQRFPFPAWIVLKVVGADEYMELSIR